MLAPCSSKSALVMSMHGKVEKDDSMDPPIQALYRRSAGASTFTAISAGTTYGSSLGERGCGEGEIIGLMDTKKSKQIDTKIESSGCLCMIKVGSTFFSSLSRRCSMPLKRVEPPDKMMFLKKSRDTPRSHL